MWEEVPLLMWTAESERLLPIYTLERVLNRVLRLRVIGSEKPGTIREVQSQKARGRVHRAVSVFAKKALLLRNREIAARPLHLRPVRVPAYEKAVQVLRQVGVVVRQTAALPVQVVRVQAAVAVQAVKIVELGNNFF